MSTSAPALNGCPATDHAPVYQTHGTTALLPRLPSEVTVVTPALAAHWLAERHANRPLRPARVSELAQVMRRQGAWKLNGEGLLLCPAGRLLDGQNRLAALLETGVSLPFLVVRGVELDAQPTLGQGKPRTGADILAMHGETNSKLLAATLLNLWRYEHACLMSTRRFPAQDTLTVMQGYPALAPALSWGNSVRRLMPGSIGGMLFYVQSQRDPARAKAFFQAVRTGLNLSEGDPSYTFRERCLHVKGRRLPRVPGWLYAYWGVLCWNCFRAGKSAPSLPWEPKLDRFPQVL